MAKPIQSAKDAVVDIVRGMPDDSSYDEIIHELVFNSNGRARIGRRRSGADDLGR